MRVESQAAPKDKPKATQGEAAEGRARLKDLWLIFLLSTASIAIHGYHPFVEDAEIYVPGIKKLLNPALYPFNDEFFAAHARYTLFPNLIAWTLKISRLPLEWILLLWHCVCIFLLLLACWKLGRICFGSLRGAWGSAALVASLLTMPVAGTALYIMDQYVNTRSFSTAASIWIIVAVLQRKYMRTAAWLFFTALMHPLMAVFAVIFAGVLVWKQHGSTTFPPRLAALLMLPLFPAVTDAYRRVLESHSYFFLLRWQWYEWLGIFAPLVLFWWFARIAHRRNQMALETLCTSSLVFGSLGFLAGLLITIPPQAVRFAELQPMRSLLLIYIALLAISGGLLAEYVLKQKLLRWAVLFLPLCGGMFYVQRLLFPATAHIEWPGKNSNNPWVQAFLWVRERTPVNSYFALDPHHMRLPGEDQHGFRAIAERSMLADQVKDSGAVTMFPSLAASWLEQVSSENGWLTFDAEGFARLHQKYGVDWVVLQQPGVPGLKCLYRNAVVLVCQIVPQPNQAKAQ